jgi:beta-lactamase regulating signal transducer with metallopeptidase domain
MEEGLSSAYYNIVLVSSEEGFIAQIKDLMIQNIQWITMIWGIGMLFFAVKILLGIHFTNSLNSASRRIEVPWVWKMLNQLKEKAHLSKYVDLRESLKIKNPSVIGFFKPCIYFPIGLINNLSPQEAEAILAHELAHIIRNDFAINIMQSIIETFFYFHPAVWWISANIRNERENACDDLAIDIVGDKIQYAKSLLLLQKWESNTEAGFAMSFSSKATPLFERMKRILNQPKNKHEMKQKIFASLILMSSIIWISATEAPKTESTTDSEFTELLAFVPETQKSLDLLVSASDTIPQKISEGKSTIVELKDGKIKRLNIDGVEIPEEEFEEYEQLNDKMGKGQAWPFMLNSDTTLTYFFGNDEGLDYDIFPPQELSDMLAEIKVKGDSIWPMINHNFQNFEHEWQFKLEESRNLMDSVFSNMDFPENGFQFHHGFHDTMRFNMDSLRAKMGDMKFYFNDMAEEFRDFSDSFDFPELKNDLRVYFDSIDLRGMTEGLHELVDSFRFQDFDSQFDFSYGNNLERAFLKELRNDKLYNNGSNTIQLSYDNLKINGESQSEEMHKKYKDIYESKTGIELLSGSNLNIKIDNSPKDDNLRKL